MMIDVQENVAQSLWRLAGFRGVRGPWIDVRGSFSFSDYQAAEGQRPGAEVWNFDPGQGAPGAALFCVHRRHPNLIKPGLDGGEVVIENTVWGRWLRVAGFHLNSQ